MDLAGFLAIALDIAEVRQAFQQVDADRDGKITLDEAYAMSARMNQPNPQQTQCVIF